MEYNMEYNYKKEYLQEPKSCLQSQTKNERDELYNMLGLLLDNIDYTSGACRINEMVGAVLPQVLLSKAKSLRVRCNPHNELT